MRPLLPLALAVALTLPAPAAERPSFAELEKAALDELRETNAPGMAVAIVSGDQIVFAKGFGVASVETGATVTPDTLFRLGSTTKMMTAAVLLELADSAHVRLDQPIAGFAKGLNPAIGRLTIHQILTHTAGLQDSSPGGAFHDDSALAAMVAGFGDHSFFTKPGDIYSYSNPGYILAGYLVEQLGGKPYADLMRERLFVPAGMTRTTLRPTDAMTYPIAQGHHVTGRAVPIVERPFYDNSARWPAGSVFTTANDWARLAIAFLNDGKIDGRQALPPSVIARLSTPYVDVPGPGAARYGYGLRLREYRGARLVEHAGSLPGFISLLRMVPDRRFAVVALVNRGGGSANKTAEKAMELLLPLGPKPPDPGPPAAATVRGADGSTEYVFSAGRAKKKVP